MASSECVVVEECITRIKRHDWQLKQNAVQLILAEIYGKNNFYLYVYIDIFVKARIKIEHDL